MKLRAVIAIVMLLSFVGCSSSTRVGDDSLLKFKDKPQERLGGKKSPEPGETPSPQATQPKQAIAAPSPQEKQETQSTFRIAVNSDTASVPGFDPPVARVFQGTAVTWANTDSVARSVEADEGGFKSPSIPPGGSWTYTASTPGRFNYHDGTRPYTVGSIEVVAKP